MTRVYSFTCELDADIVDAFCLMQKGFTDQFVYYDKARKNRYLGLGRCIALPSLDDVEYELEGAGARLGDAIDVARAARAEGVASVVEGAVDSADVEESTLADDVDGADCAVGVAVAGAVGGTGASACSSQPPVFFSFNRFDAENPAPTDELFEAFPRLRFMLPEVVLVENERGTMLQVNSLSPVYAGRVARFLKQARQAPPRTHASVPFSLVPDSREAWSKAVGQALSSISGGRVEKVVLSRRQKLAAAHPFSSKDLLVNLIDGSARGTVILYRYADVFFCGCTPELLVRKRGHQLESMCLAGTCPAGSSEDERARLAAELLSDAKNRAEHDYVVKFIREVFGRTCYDVNIPDEPGILPLQHVQHLHTPASARVLEGVDLWSMKDDLHPTPAVAGAPVGEAKMLIRRIESFNRGLFAGAAGYVDGAGDGEFSVALRTGVFDGEIGWVYAGCGIVAGSVADDEYDEIGMKLQTILSAFEAPGE